jgi:hypothetical protein
MMTLTRVLIGVTLAVSMAACGDRSPVPTHTPTPAGVHVVVTGIVRDTEDRPLQGARVEILTDSNAIAVTDRNGHFSVSGVAMATGYVHLRASRHGYASATSWLTVPAANQVLPSNGLRLTAGCDAPAFAC